MTTSIPTISSTYNTIVGCEVVLLLKGNVLISLENQLPSILISKDIHYTPMFLEYLNY
jgi:hypothetical protein